MSAPRRVRADRLWRRLADAQDAALQSEPLFRGVPPAARAATALPRRRRRLAAVAVGVAVGVAAAAAALVFSPRPSALRFQLANTGERGAPGRALAADARSDLPLEFSDGSTVTFRAGSAGRVERLTGQGAEVILDRGRLDAHVVHAGATIWRVHAGPFQVRVTGTRFSTDWSGERLEVALYEGRVVVDGALLGTGVPLRAGQRLSIEGGVVRTEALGAPAALAPAPTAFAPAPPAPAPPAPASPAFAPLVPASVARSADATPTSPAAALLPLETAPLPPASASALGSRRSIVAGSPSDDEWLALADRGRHEEALRSAERLGWSELCRREDARRLLILGDVARYAGARAQAGQAFEALTSRFPRDHLAADAVFSLGRLAFEAHEDASAARWFRRYVDEWPQGPLAEQAAGRLLEAAIRLDDREAAREAARAYLASAPGGPRAVLARDVLADPGDVRR